MLARPADSITLAEIVEAIEGAVFDAPMAVGLASAEAWRQAGAVLSEHLASVTLADLAARQSAIDAERAPMYFI